MHLTSNDRLAFDRRENKSGGAYFDSEFPGLGRYKDARFRLLRADARFNLAPSIREQAERYFKRYDISWHTHANHALSSQVCCLNFLMPLAERPHLLSRLVGRALGIVDPEMLPVEAGPDDRSWFIGFEWIGGDYLNESRADGCRTRGSNCTSADAVLHFRHGGRTETLLIEWKYTEKYGAPISPAGNATRIARYQDLLTHPAGPLRPELGLHIEDFFWEPFYQLVRQQMLAFQMQKAREDGADRVRVLHIAPAANAALRNVTAPALKHLGEDAFAVFRSLLVKPEDFVSWSTESLFGPMLEENSTDDWASYLRRRYRFVIGPT